MNLVFSVLMLLVSFSAQAADDAVLFGVNEGSSGSADFRERQEKYKPLAEYLSKAIGKPVRLESAQDLKSLTKNLEKARYGLLLVRPSHISAKAMRDQRYVLVASAKGDAYTYFITRSDSALKTPQDIKGQMIAMPDQLAYPTHAGIAMLRDIGITPEAGKVHYLRTQEAVGYAVEQNLSGVGVVISYSKVAKEWTKNGHKILWQSKKLPFWSVIASPKLGDQTVAAVRTALLKLSEQPGGEAIMKNIGVNGFVAGSQQDYLALLNWIEAAPATRADSGSSASKL